MPEKLPQPTIPQLSEVTFFDYDKLSREDFYEQTGLNSWDAPTIQRTDHFLFAREIGSEKAGLARITSQGVVFVNHLLPNPCFFLNSPGNTRFLLRSNILSFDVERLVDSGVAGLPGLAHEFGHLYNQDQDIARQNEHLEFIRDAYGIKKREKRKQPLIVSHGLWHVLDRMVEEEHKLASLETNAWETAKPLVNILEIPPDQFERVRQLTLQHRNLVLLDSIWNHMCLAVRCFAELHPKFQIQEGDVKNTAKLLQTLELKIPNLLEPKNILLINGQQLEFQVSLYNPEQKELLVKEVTAETNGLTNHLMENIKTRKLIGDY